MTVDLDFEAAEVQASASAIAAGATATLCTLSIGSTFPLQAGRVLALEFDYVGEDSNHVPLGSYLRTVVPSTSVNPGTTLQLYGNMPSMNGGAVFVWNGSGDLEVQWENTNTGGSGITQDISVRVRMRWVGS